MTTVLTLVLMETAPLSLWKVQNTSRSLAVSSRKLDSANTGDLQALNMQHVIVQRHNLFSLFPSLSQAKYLSKCMVSLDLLLKQLYKTKVSNSIIWPIKMK